MTKFTIAVAVAASASGVFPLARTACRAFAAGEREAASEFSVAEKPILELQEALRTGKTTSVALVAAYLERIRKYDKTGPEINAMIALNPRAPEDARALDEERRKRGGRGPLHGIPIVVKDNYSTADLPTTAASKALEGFETGRDGFMV